MDSTLLWIVEGAEGLRVRGMVPDSDIVPRSGFPNSLSCLGVQLIGTWKMISSILMGRQNVYAIYAPIPFVVQYFCCW